MPGNLPNHRRFDDFRCHVCGTSISRKAARTLHTCGDWKCRLEHNTQLQAKVRESRLREEEKRREFRNALLLYRDQCAVNAGVPDSAQFVPVCVPKLSRPLVAVSEHRREQLRVNLRRLIDTALKLDAMSPVIESARQDAPASPVEVESDPGPGCRRLPVLLSRACETACATCQGYCCTTGEEHGHLTAEHIRVYLDTHPVGKTDRLIDDYVTRVQDETHEGSCIFHGPDGCTLPREMRSDVCNAFECFGLKDVHEEVTENRRTRLFLVAHDSEGSRRHCFLDLNPTASDQSGAASAESTGRT